MELLEVRHETVYTKTSDGWYLRIYHYFATATGSVVSVPYTVETNDIPMMALQHQRSDELLRRSSDHFDRIYQESAAITRVMAVSMHPYLSGVPHRIKYVEAIFEYMKRHEGVLFWTGGQILNWYKSVRPKA